ncbi:MAG: S41 family peptidase [Ignavibacteriae bacterium HGW-Ignavibacteriae-3]|nr:MAG: S41 family peptidase [Ignavibacteriae bacterium HGW-Ignavibacteriae-3]
MKIRKMFILSMVSIILFSGFVTRDNDIYLEINKGIDIFGRVYKEVALNYVEPLNPEEFMLAGINGMLTSLDPYTNFIDQNQQKDFEIITKGRYGGIGASVGVRNDKVTVVDLIEGYSAQRQGIRIGDIITMIDETPVSKENLENLSELLKGDPGTAVKIIVKRETVNEPIIFNLLREEIEVRNVTYYGFVPEESNNAYIKLSGFSRAAGDEVKKAILDLKSKKEISSLVLDLRGNPGGLLDAAINVSEKFLKKGQLIVSVKGRDSLSSKNYYSSEEPLVSDVKMILLIDEGSASASEIVAGAIQDHDRALLVGTNTFGKGLVQTVLPLSYNTSLKITTARYFTPSGRSIQKIDYSDKNKVFEQNNRIKSAEFQTDAKRTVFSGGGIIPDTTVKNVSNSYFVQTLLAEGMFFKFATHYFNNDPAKDWSGIKSNLLFKEFTDYLKEEKYEFTSKSEKLIDQLIVTGTEESIDKNFIDQLNKVKIQLDGTHTAELEKYKDDVIFEIREELSARTGGREGRIKESLKFDKQFLTAYNLLSDTKKYNSVMRK